MSGWMSIVARRSGQPLRAASTSPKPRSVGGSLARSGRRRANAAIEFALLLPVVITLFGSIIDLSLFVTRAHVIQRAARDAARVGSATLESGAVHTGAGIITASKDQATAALTQAGLPCGAGCTVSAEWRTVSGTRVIFVSIKYPYDAIMGVIPVLPTQIRADFTMMTQQQS